MNAKFYIQKTDKTGTTIGNPVSIEDTYQGLKYLSCKGLESVGKPKNIYSESYAEMDGVRLYHPSDSNSSVTNDSTTVTLSLLFIGEDRRNVYKSFLEYVKSSRFYWWDNVRNKKAWLVLDTAVEPTEDVVKADGYMMAEFKFTNIWGKTIDTSV